MRVAQWLGGLSLVAACGGGGGGDSGGGVDAPDQKLPDAPPGFADMVAPRIVGSYAMKQQIAQIRNLPVVGMQSAVVRSLGIGTIRREGEGFVIEEKGCHILPEMSGNVSTKIDDSVPRSVPAITTQLEVVPDGSRVIWRRVEVGVVVGAHLASSTDALPTMGTDARVWDQDGDNHPGVTAHVSGIATGDVYVVQRQRTAYAGELAADGHLTGRLTDRSEQSTVAASNPLLNQNIASTPDPDPSKSTIELVRTTEAWSCDRLVAEAGSVFP